MYFKRLELHGFKSFAEPVVIDFHEGITCVVGPNGSGKSNISDAIRWVLGEQSPKALRGGKMEEVIFNGTENRRPRGLAEVTLVIDNSAGILDIDYNEVAITRRMYRSGESEYMINSNACRLKDIRELIMDTGIGVDGYSIIGQGKIADIVSNKPESRRQIFEEAAGVVAYKTRKAESERKLENTRGNLERIDDIVNEIEGRIDGLKSDSTKAKRYLELKEKYKSLEINVTLRNIDNANKRNEQYKGDIADFEGKINFIRNNKRSVDTESNEVSKRSATLDKMSSDARNKLMDIVDKINSISQTSEVNREKLASLDKDEKRLNSEITELNSKIEDSNKEVDRLTTEKEDHTSRLHEAENILEERVYAYNHVTSESSKFAAVIDEGNDKLFKLHSKASASKSEAKSIESYKTTMEKRRIQLERDMEQLSSELLDANSNLREVENAGRTAVDNKERIDKESLEIQRRQRNLTEQQDRLRPSIEQLRISSSQMISRKKTIEEMENNYEGYNYAVRFIMKSGISGIEGVVGDLMKVPGGFESAIETALGSSMQNVVCANDQSAQKAVNSLKHNRAGRLTFLPVESIDARKITLNDAVSNDAGFKGIGSDIIKFDPRYRRVFEYLLGRVAVVDTLETAIKLSKVGGRGVRFVTMDGEIINASGAITGGKYRNKTANLLERKNEIAKLANDIEETDRNLEEQMRELQGVKEAFVTVNKSLSIIEEEKRDNEIEIAGLNNKKNNVDNSIAELESNINKNKLEIESIARELEDTDSMIAKMLNESKDAENDIARITQDMEAAMSDNESRKKEIEKANAEVTESRIEAGKWSSKLSGTESVLARVKAEYEDLRKQTEEKSNELIQLGRSRNQLMYGYTDEGAQLEQLQQERKSTEEFISGIEKEKNELNQRMEEIKQQLQDAEGDLNTYQDSKYQLEIKMARNDTQLDTMKDKLWEEFEVSYAQADDYKLDDFAMSSAVKETREIRNEMKELGDVNVGAISEYESVSQRYNFLTEQRSDVVAAMRELESIISNMNTTITRTFKDNFNLIESNFERVFTELFGGGHAELRLENENDPLESGIDIIAQPPGKRLQNINLMSGGEKTMTAIALMFAVLDTKPTPFCILDEVEAALDDDNIEKFAAYLKHFNKTQFALITHQKATMEHADVLYGVTMPEQGVSKVLSLRLGDYDPDDYTS